MIFKPSKRNNFLFIFLRASVLGRTRARIEGVTGVVGARAKSVLGESWEELGAERAEEALFSTLLLKRGDAESKRVELLNTSPKTRAPMTAMVCPLLWAAFRSGGDRYSSGTPRPTENMSSGKWALVEISLGSWREKRLLGGQLEGLGESAGSHEREDQLAGILLGQRVGQQPVGR